MSKALAKDAANLSLASRFRVPGIQVSPLDISSPVEWSRAIRYAAAMHDGWLASSAVSAGSLPDRSEPSREALLTPWKWGSYVANILEAVAHAIIAVVHIRAAAAPDLTLAELSIPRSAFIDDGEGSISGLAAIELARILTATARGLRICAIRDKHLFARRDSNALGEHTSASAELRQAHWFVIQRGKSVKALIRAMTEVLTGPVDPRCAPRRRAPATASAASAASSSRGAAASAAGGAAAVVSNSRGARRADGSSGSASSSAGPTAGPQSSGHSSVFSARLDLLWWLENCFFTALGEAAKADGMRDSHPYLEGAWAQVEAAEAASLAALKRVGGANPAAKKSDKDRSEEPAVRDPAGGGRSGGRGGGRGGRGTDRNGSTTSTHQPSPAASLTSKSIVRALPSAERDTLRATLSRKDVKDITKVEAVKADLCYRCKHSRHPPGASLCDQRGVSFAHGPCYE